jgi:porphobilinogen deaminase
MMVLVKMTWSLTEMHTVGDRVVRAPSAAIHRRGVFMSSYVHLANSVALENPAAPNR